MAGTMLLPVLAFANNGNNAHIHIEATHPQFVINHVLHQMASLRLAEVDTCVAQPQVHEINVILYGIVGYRRFILAWERVGYSNVSPIQYRTKSESIGAMFKTVKRGN